MNGITLPLGKYRRHSFLFLDVRMISTRMVSRSAPMPLNGQQLMMQLDGLTSAMTGMSVQEVSLGLRIFMMVVMLKRLESAQLLLMLMPP